jgi:hypothetical protein
MARGEHIYVCRTELKGVRVGELTLYTHHAVDVGGGTVIEYVPTNGAKRQSIVTRRTIEEFAQGARVKTVEYAVRLDPEEAAARAERMLGSGDYDFLHNNCEHFATWCVTGKATSAQIENGKVSAGMACTTAVAPSLGVGVVTELGEAAVRSGPNLMSGLCRVGGSVVGGVTVIAGASGLAGTGLTHALLRDKPALPAAERNARQTGRQASVAGAAGGTLLAVYAVGKLGVPGYSATGISSGLAELGAVTGHGMARGIATVGLLPLLAAIIIGYLTYRFLRHRAPQLPALPRTA